MALTDELQRLEQIRAKNPAYKDVNDVDLARMVNRSSGELSELANSSGPMRAIASGSNVLSALGRKAESAIADETSSFPVRVAGRTASNLIGSAPEIGLNLAAARLLPQSRLAAGGLGAANVVGSYARTKAETGDTKAAVGSAVGTGASLAGGILGGRVGRKLGGGSGVKAALGGAAGSYAGSIPGDVLGIATAPGGLEEFLKDPVNLPAYLAAQAPFAAVDYFEQRGQAAKGVREEKVAKIPSLAEAAPLPDEQRYVELQKVPVAQLSDLQVSEMKKLRDRLEGRVDRKTADVVVQNQVPKGPGSYQEAERLLWAVSKGRKPAAFFPKGAEIPTMPIEAQRYVEHTRPEGTWVFNPELLTPQQIDAYAEQNKLGDLESQGVQRDYSVYEPDPYAGMTEDFEYIGFQPGFAHIPGMELWNPRRTLSEKLAAGTTLSRKTIEEAGFKLPPQSAKRSAILESGSTTRKGYETQPDLSVDLRPRDSLFSNMLFDRLDAAFKGTSGKGAKFQLDPEGNISGKGLGQAIRKWAPPEILAELEAKGLATIESAPKVNPAAFARWLQQSVPSVEVKKLVPSVVSGTASNAATGRFGADPIDASKMDRPKDILVRSPEELQFTGPHFGAADKNVLASVRGYFDKPDRYYAFEVQSDWANVNKELPNLIGSSPLLSSYETIGLKTAIKEALAGNASKIVVPTGETALGIQGLKKGQPQESGMVQHYDRNIPNILRKLTGVEPKVVDLVGDKPGKGYEFDLGSLSPEVDRLFSLYGMEDQMRYESQLKQATNELDAAILSGKDVTLEQFLDASNAGKNLDRTVALDYLKNLAGSSANLVKLFTADPRVAGFADSAGKLGINTALGAEKAFRTAGHEMSHLAFNELQRTNKAAADDFVNFVDSIPPQERANMLRELFTAVGMKDIDADYQAGLKFDPADPNTPVKSAKEFAAGLAEVLAADAYKNDATINSKIAEHLSFLPLSVQQWLSKLVGQMGRFFGPEQPSMRYFTDPEQRETLVKAYDKIIKFIKNNENAQARAYKQLKRTGLFDEADFVNQLGDPDYTGWKSAVRSLTNSSPGGEEFRDLSLNWVKNIPGAKTLSNAYEEMFFNPLFRTKTRPETLEWFQELHKYKPKIKDFEFGYMESLGQDANSSLSREQALTKYHEMIDRLTASPATLQKMSKVIAKNNELRDKLLSGENAPSFVKKEQLVTKEQMASQYGLKPDEVEFLDRLIDMPAKVAEQQLRFMQATDTVNLSKLLYIQNKKQDIKQVKQKSAELTRLSGEAGSRLMELNFYRENMERLAKSGENPQLLAELEAKAYGLQQEVNAYKQQFEAAMRTLFANEIQFSGKPGEDGFVNQVNNLAFRLGQARAEQQFIMKDEGYAPMTRRGRYLVRVFNSDAQGGTLPTTKSYHGFATEQEIKNFVQKNKLKQSEYEVTDKQDLEKRASLYTSRQLQSVRDKARQDLKDMIGEYATKIQDYEPTYKQAVMLALGDIANGFQPLDQELKDVVSVKGDKFKERRWKVAGFDENDFIPNIFEYMQYKTTSGQKALTKAEASLQMQRPEVQADPRLLNRMEQETEYAMNRTSEATTLRKTAFYLYLGASFRHMVQNMLQLPLNGIPEAVSTGSGFNAYSNLGKAAAMSLNWAKNGTTGNKEFDVLLKQAEKEGVTVPNALEIFAPESEDVQLALDSVNSDSNGLSHIGSKAKLAANRTWRGLEKMLRSTAVASEQVNRRTSFLMSLLESKRKGKTDLREMFNEANRFTDYVNFVGDKSNRPGFQTKLGKSYMHAPVMVATALQSFVLNHISQLYSYAKLAAKGDKDALKGFATGMAHMAIVGGAMGLPMAETVNEVLKEAFDVDLKTAIRRGIVASADQLFDLDTSQRIADSVLNGFPNLVGVNMNDSVGLGSPLVRYKAGEDMSVADLLGPVGSLGNKFSRGLNAITADPWNPEQWFTATRRVAPQALNQFIKAADAIEGKVTDSSGNPVVDKIDGVGTAAVILGFTPTQAKNIRDLNDLKRKNAEKVQAEYRSTMETVARSLSAFQETGNPEALENANRVFSRYMQEQQGTVDPSSAVKSVNQQLSRTKTPSSVAQTPREKLAFADQASAYRGIESGPELKLPAYLQELQVAQMLQQPQVVEKLAKNNQGIETRAIFDLLIQAGLPEDLAQALSSGNTESLLRRSAALP